MSSTEAKPIPSPMSEKRLLVMQRRAAEHEPLSQPTDQPVVTADVQSRARGRYAKIDKDGFRVMARTIGHKSKTQSSKEAKFNEDGDEIEDVGQFTLLDRYLSIALNCRGPLTAEWWRALTDWKLSR